MDFILQLVGGFAGGREFFVVPKSDGAVLLDLVFDRLHVRRSIREDNADHVSGVEHGGNNRVVWVRRRGGKTVRTCYISIVPCESRPFILWMISPATGQ